MPRARNTTFLSFYIPILADNIHYFLYCAALILAQMPKLQTSRGAIKILLQFSFPCLCRRFAAMIKSREYLYSQFFKRGHN